LASTFVSELLIPKKKFGVSKLKGGVRSRYQIMFTTLRSLSCSRR